MTQPDMLQPGMTADQPADVVEMPSEEEEVNQGVDLAASVYQRLGIDNPGVTIKGYRSSIQDLKPGDLVGWNGGQEPDGRYVGNIAVWAGDGEIIEQIYGHNRRRKLAPNENTFGIPVNLPGEENTGDDMGDIDAVD